MECASGVVNPCPNNLPGASAHFFLSLINTLMLSQCTLGPYGRYHRDYAPQVKEDDEFDFIIVGGGSAGSVLANRLTEIEKWKVLLVEAGDYPSAMTEIPALLFSHQETKEDWNYKTEPSERSCLGMKGKQCHYPRGKVLGGSSAINAMVHVHPNRRDLDHWAELGNVGWNYDSFQHYLKKSEDVTGTRYENNDRYGQSGFLKTSIYSNEEPITEALKKAAHKLGYEEYSDEKPLGYVESLMTIHDGRRNSASKAFLSPIKDRPNLFVALNSHATKIIFDKKQPRKVVGIQIVTLNKTLNLHLKKELILSAGSINSPKILLLSGIGPQDHLESVGIETIRNLPVGLNFHDHQMFYGKFAKINSKAARQFAPLDLLDDVYKFFAHKTGEMTRISITNFIGFVNTKNDSQFADVQFHHILYRKNDQYLLPEMIRCAGYVDEIAGAQIKHNSQANIFSIMPILLQPKSRGRVSLRSKRPEDDPVIVANFFDDGDDVEVLLRGLKHALKILRGEELSEFEPELVDLEIPGCGHFGFDTDDYWRCAIRSMTGSLFHPVGTCRMGPKGDGSAVVDPELRVHGVDNLRVVDASIMPRIVSANTNSAVLAIAEKGADLIKEKWAKIKDEL